MRLTLRIFLWMGAAFALVWIGHSLSVVDRRLEEIDRELRGGQELLGQALRPAIERAARTRAAETCGGPSIAPTRIFTALKPPWSM